MRRNGCVKYLPSKWGPTPGITTIAEVPYLIGGEAVE
jgi:hypothetical protein